VKNLAKKREKRREEIEREKGEIKKDKT
jgi:hypothetical protein